MHPHPLWFEWLAPVTGSPEFQALLRRVKEAESQGRIYPPTPERYAALALSPLDVRVVILGQDPYHGPGQAHGLSFSVRPGVAIPPSLANVYKEIEDEGLGEARGRNGCLQKWHDQGVLLLNTSLSVAAGKAGSHRGWGWEAFTDAVVRELSARREGLVFLLWGKAAGEKAALIDRRKHRVLTSAHPSPYSAAQGFFGNGHFRQTNEWLQQHGSLPIVW